MMLTIESLRAGYKETQILFDVNLVVPEGEIVCLMGRNGVGKTTLLNTIMGLVQPTAGKIIFRGRDISALAPHLRAKAGIGYIPQGRGIFSGLTVYENLLTGMEAKTVKAQSRVAKRREEEEAVERALGMFPALEAFLSRKGGNLSGGQQQQLAIARALMSKPSMLLLDEPTEGIQPSIIEQIGENLLKIKDSMDVSMLLVEQYVDFAMNIADRYYFMETGAIVEQGLVSELTEEIIRKNMEI